MFERVDVIMNSNGQPIIGMPYDIEGKNIEIVVDNKNLTFFENTQLIGEIENVHEDLLEALTLFERVGIIELRDETKKLPEYVNNFALVHDMQTSETL